MFQDCANIDDSAKKFLLMPCLTLVLLLLSQSAYAQDMTFLVVALAPPILLAPLFLTFARWFWLRRRPGSPVRFVPLLAVSSLDVLLWLAIGVSFFMVMTGDSDIGAPVLLVVAFGAAWMLSRIWFDRSQRVARWLFFASPPVVLALLLAVSWVVLIALDP